MERRKLICLFSRVGVSPVMGAERRQMQTQTQRQMQPKSFAVRSSGRRSHGSGAPMGGRAENRAEHSATQLENEGLGGRYQNGQGRVDKMRGGLLLS